MKILQEFNIDGRVIKGRITGNWSKDSEHGFKLADINTKDYMYGEKELEELINELDAVLNKIQELNEHHSRYW